MSDQTDRLQLLLLSSIYLVLVGIFFNLEGGPPNWIWLPFWTSLVPALLAFALVVKGLFSGSQPSNASRPDDR